MAKFTCVANALFVLALIFGSAIDAHAKETSSFEIRGVVVSISDGDTIDVRRDADGVTDHVRFADIDAPEIDHGPDRPGQPYGVAARGFLRSKVSLYEEVVAKCYEHDAHGRSVCRVYSSRGIDLSLAMVSAGYAQAYRRYLRDSSLLTVEDLARQQRLGQWADSAAIAPETWRKICWSPSDRIANPFCSKDAAAGLSTTSAVPATQPSQKPTLAGALQIYSDAKGRLSDWFASRFEKLANL